MEPQNKSYKTIGIVVAVVIIAIVLVVIFTGKKPVDTTATTTDQTPTTAADTTATTPAQTVADTGKKTASEYKDGTYSATGSYMSPGGPDQVALSLTLKNDIITDATCTPEPGDNTSSRYQAIFAANYKQYVIGKDISTVHLTKVSGSSLTSKGFNDALAQIETQAKA
jgi:uncharacterized protein with FMN-binding domain